MINFLSTGANLIQSESKGKKNFIFFLWLFFRTAFKLFIYNAEEAMDLEKALSDIKETAKVLYFKGWAEASAGNMSVIIDEDIGCADKTEYDLPDRFENLCGKTVVITSSGSRMRQIADGKAEDYCSFVKVSASGASYFRPVNKHLEPSSELLMHLMLHNEFSRRKKGISAVLHCHPDEIITLLHLHDLRAEDAVNSMLFSMHTEAEMLIPEGVGLTGLKKPGSFDLASAVLGSFKKHKIVLLERHGAASAGKDLSEALDRIEFVNKAANIFLNLNKIKK